MRKLTPILVILGTILAITLVTGSPCFSADGVIDACYKKINGQLRILTDQKGCSASEVPISWNQGGSQGPAGPAGPMGSGGGLDLSKIYTKTCNNDPIARYQEASNECFCSDGDIALSAAVSCLIEDTINHACIGDICFPYVYVGNPTVLTYEEYEASGKIISGYKAQCAYTDGPPNGYSIRDFPNRIDLRCAKP